MPNVAAEPPRQAPQPAQDAPDKTARYMARLEDHLAALPAPARLPRLLELKLWWLAEFERWAWRVDAGTATATDLKSNAFDFRMTIDAVSRRHAQEQRAATPEHAQDGWTAGSAGIAP